MVLLVVYSTHQDPTRCDPCRVNPWGDRCLFQAQPFQQLMRLSDPKPRVLSAAAPYAIGKVPWPRRGRPVLSEPSEDTCGRHRNLV